MQRFLKRKTSNDLNTACFLMLSFKKLKLKINDDLNTNWYGLLLKKKKLNSLAKYSTYYLLSKAYFNASRFNILKIKFKGKFAKWFRRRGKIILKFGKTHLSYVHKTQLVFYKKRNRTTFIIFSTKYNLVWNFYHYVCTKRYYNFYHNRGVRAARSKIYRKDGLVSAYR